MQFTNLHVFQIVLFEAVLASNGSKLAVPKKLSIFHVSFESKPFLKQLCFLNCLVSQTTEMLEHAFHIWKVCSQSHLEKWLTNKWVQCLEESRVILLLNIQCIIVYAVYV